MTALIDLTRVSKVFGPHPDKALTLAAQGATKAEILSATSCSLALHDITLAIPAGRIFVLMGLSGSGKSTLIRHINRLIEPTSGEIAYDGRDVLSLSRRDLLEFRRRSVSMVFQSFALLPHLNVLQNVALGLLARGEPKASARDRALWAIRTVALNGYETAWPSELSGGMKQRVGLARALAVDAQTILMDEAFSALDPLIRADMQDHLLNLQKHLSKTIVFVTHDLAEAIRLGDAIAILRDGALVQTGKPQDIINSPADDDVARFVSVARRNGLSPEA